MNKNTYLILPDIDELIIAHLEPPQILSLSEVNQYFLQKVVVLRGYINRCKYNFEDAVSEDNTRSAKWLISTVKWNNGRGTKIVTLERALLIACQYGNIPMAEWTMEYATNSGCIIHGALGGIFNYIGVGDINVTEWLIREAEKSGRKIMIHSNGEWAFWSACSGDNIHLAKMFITLGEGSYGKINIHARRDKAFRRACKNGHIDIAKWLISLGEGLYGRIDIHIDNEKVFRDVCQCGHVDIAEWIIALGEESHGRIDVQDCISEALCNAINYNKIDVVDLLLRLAHTYGPYLISIIKVSVNSSDIAERVIGAYADGRIVTDCIPIRSWNVLNEDQTHMALRLIQKIKDAEESVSNRS